MLLDRIIELATDEDRPLSVLLRQCVVLAHEMKNDSLKTWANQELNGYTDVAKLPEYRIVHTGATGTFNAGYAFPTVRRPIPPAAMQEGHRWAATEVRLFEPVSAYENALKSTTGKMLVYHWPADMIAYYQEQFIQGHALLQAWQEVSHGAIAGMLDTVRTRVLNVALDIRGEIGESDADLRKVSRSSEAAEKVNHIVVNHIYGGTVYVGDRQTINSQSISVGNWGELSKALLALGIQEGEIKELSKAVEQDGKRLGNGVKGWIGKNAAKVWDHGVQLGTSVGTAVLTEYLKRHFGL